MRDAPFNQQQHPDFGLGSGETLGGVAGGVGFIGSVGRGCALTVASLAADGRSSVRNGWRASTALAGAGSGAIGGSAEQ